MTMTDPRPIAGALEQWQADLNRRGIEPADQPIPAGLTDDDLEQLRERQHANRAAWYTRHLPARYAAAALTDLEPAQNPDRAVTGWLDTDSPTLLLVGPVGTGKTHAAYATCNTALASGALVVACRVPELLQALRPDGDATLAARATTADLLLLDDLGVEKSSEWTVEQLGTLIDARIRDCRRQIVTTNATYEQLADRLGDRTASRLTGHGATLAVLSGADRRRLTW